MLFGIDNIILYQIVIGVIIVVVGVGLYIRQHQGGYFAVFLKKQTGGYAKITTQRFNPTQKTLQFGKKSFIINMINMGFRDDTNRFGAKFIYYFDYGTAKQLSFEEFKQAVDAEDLDLMVSRNIISQLVSRFGGSAVGGMNIILIILGVGLGIAVGFILGQYLGIEQVIVQPTNTTTILPSEVFP